jgi:hypothetical protein
MYSDQPTQARQNTEFSSTFSDTLDSSGFRSRQALKLAETRSAWIREFGCRYIYVPVTNDFRGEGVCSHPQSRSKQLQACELNGHRALAGIKL